MEITMYDSAWYQVHIEQDMLCSTGVIPRLWSWQKEQEEEKEKKGKHRALKLYFSLVVVCGEFSQLV